MKFFPVRKEVFPLPYSAQRVEALLYRTIKKKDEEVELILGEKVNPIFNGWVNRNQFRISLIIKQPQTFLPLVKGKITSTSTGCIVECTYVLFYSTQLFLAFWTLITFGLTVLYTIISYQLTHALFAGALGIGNYLIAISNFKLYVKRTQRHIKNVFEAS